MPKKREKVTLFHNGNIITMNESPLYIETVAIQGEKILQVGKYEQLMEEYEKYANIIDLKGKTMLPGFIDSHLHPIIYLFFLFNLDLSEIKSFRQLRKVLQKEIEKRDKNELILGLNLKEEIFDNSSERKLPTRWELDKIVPDYPIFLLRYDGHIGVANSKALELANIDSETTFLEGGEIRRNDKGEITGVLTENAISLMLSKVSLPDSEKILETADKAFKYLASKGLTSLHGVLQLEPGGETGDLGGFEIQILKNVKEKVLQNWYSLIYTHNPKKIKRVKKPPLDGGKLDSKFKVGCLKLYADGTFGGATAYMFEPFSDQPDERGFLVTPEDILYEKMKKAHKLGYQIGIHAIGDKANRIVVDLYKQLLKEYPKKDHRHRIEHASMLTSDVIEDMKELNLVAACQPPFINSEYTWLEKRLGKERCKYTYPMKSIIDAGILLSAGSDCPVEEPDVILGLDALVNRNEFVPEERISIFEALKAYTINGAYASFEEDIKGTIEEGKLADLVILDKNPLEIGKDQINEIKVLETIVRGKTVYQL
jgi:predicted amidohydrolase YtcJ